MQVPPRAPINMEQQHIVVGMGEVGQAIQKVFSADHFDTKSKAASNCPHWHYQYLHICIPYSVDFIKTVNFYKDKFSPITTIIHSTVPVGTSRKCNALHSPIRGIHPYLYEGVMTFTKFIGGADASEVADVFRKAGLKICLCDKQETTELGKLLDTEYYRYCIEFSLVAKAQADKFSVPFHEAYTLFNMSYNEGYTTLNHPEFVRPVLQPIAQPIGGHCVKQNQKLLSLSEL